MTVPVRGKNIYLIDIYMIVSLAKDQKIPEFIYMKFFAL